MGYAYNVPNTDLYVGANAKIINSALESYNSFGAAVDLGAIYIDEYNGFNYAVSLRTIGTQITTYAGTTESPPLEVTAGISPQFETLPAPGPVTLTHFEQWDVSFVIPAVGRKLRKG